MKETHILKTAGKDHFPKDEKEKFKLVYILHVTPVLPMTCAVLGSN